MWAQDLVSGPRVGKSYEESHVNGAIVKSVATKFMVLALHLNDNQTMRVVIQMETYHLFEEKFQYFRLEFEISQPFEKQSELSLMNSA